MILTTPYDELIDDLLRRQHVRFEQLVSYRIPVWEAARQSANEYEFAKNYLIKEAVRWIRLQPLPSIILPENLA